MTAVAKATKKRAAAKVAAVTNRNSAVHPQKILWSVALWALLLVSMGAKAQSVRYFEGSVTEAVDAARRRGKPLIVEFYAPWNYKSQWARTEMIGKSDAIRRGEFLLTAVETTTPQGAKIAAGYGVVEYPSILVMNAIGAVVDRIDRTMDSTDFAARIAQIQLASDGQSTLALRRIYTVAMQGETRREDLNIMVDNYLSSHAVDPAAVMDLFTSKAINYYGSAAWRYMTACRAEFDSVWVEDRVRDLLFEALLPTISGAKAYDSLFLDEVARGAKGYTCAPLIEGVVRLASLRAADDPLSFVFELELLVDRIPRAYALPVALSVEWIDPKRIERSARRIAARAVERLAGNSMSEAKNAAIDALVGKFL